MIVKCKKNDEQIVESYIGKEYYKCLYLYMNLQRYGIGSQVIDVYMKKTAMCTAWMMTPCCTDFYRLSPATQKACTAPAEPLFSFRQCMPYL